MTLAQIQYFLTVAEESNVSKAAERLYMTQPALSRQIAAIEEELGIQLFIRKSRPIKLTPAGRVLYEGWKHLHQEYDVTLSKASAKAKGIEGSISIGVVSGIEIGDFFPDILKSFREDYPTIDVDVDCTGFSDLQKGLSDWKYDMILTYDFDKEYNDKVEIVNLEQIENFFVCSTALTIPEKEEYMLEDFMDYPFIVNTPEDTPGGFTQFMDKVQKTNLQPIFKFAQTANQYMLLIDAGYGVSVLSRRSTLYGKGNLRFLHTPVLDHNCMILEWNKSNENPSLQIGKKLFMERFGL